MQVMGIETGYNALSAQKVPHREYNKIAGASIVNVGKWERIGSALLGGFLVYRAIKSRNFLSLLTGSSGLTLLNRGISGYCPGYNKAGISSTNT